MEIQDIKSRLEILQVLRSYNLKPNKHEMLSCPFHENDKTPSLKAYTRTNTFYCFSCGATGDQIQFIELYEKLTKHEAIEKAKTLANSFINIKPNPMEQTDDKSLLPRIAVLSKIAQDSKASFKRTAKARDYLHGRGLDTDKMEVGYLGADFGKGWNKNLQESGIKLGILKQSRQNTLVPKFKNCILFFTKNEKGQIIDLYGRSINPNGESKHFYLNGHHQGIYPKYPEPGTTKLIFTESFIDCATLEQQPEITKHYRFVSLFGTNGLTGEILESVKELPELDEAILFFDGDKAGKEAINKVNDKLQKIKPGIKVTAVDTPKDEDVNSLLQSLSREERIGRHNPEILIHLLKERTLVPVKKDVEEKQGDDTQAPPEPELNITNPNKIIYNTPTANYYIKGGLRKELDNMRVSIDIENKETRLKKRERTDLYIDKLVEKLAREAAEKLNLRADLLEADLNKLTGLLDEYREQELLPEDEELAARRKKEVKVPPMVADGCIKFLKQGELMKQFLKKIRQAGLVGEDRNCQLVFCIGSSAKMLKALHGIIQGSTGKGKTYLMNTICSMMPPEYYIPLTALTDKSLFNNGKYDIRFHLFAIEDRDTMSDEVRLYFRELISKEEISRHVTRADKEGNYKTVFQLVLGPIASLSCTTNGELYPDDANRCFLISVDESPGQMQRIIDQRNKKAAGLIDEKKELGAREFIQNCIRLLQQYKVVNPYATRVHLPPDAKDINRLHELFIRLINQITILHQYQREKDPQGRLITTIGDVELAVNIMFDAIVIKVDDLPENLRKFIERLKSYIKGKAGGNYHDYNFKLREARISLNMNKSALDNYVQSLLEMEYLQKTGGNDHKGYIYKISFWDDLEALRKRIKDYLFQQVEKIKKDQKPENQ